jgi:hypothetical protein
MCFAGWYLILFMYIVQVLEGCVYKRDRTQRIKNTRITLDVVYDILYVQLSDGKFNPKNFCSLPALNQ